MNDEFVSCALFNAEIASIRREIEAVDRLHTETNQQRDKAVEVGFAASTEKGKMHNDLIDKGEKMQSTFVTRSEAAWLVMFILAFVIASIAVADFFGTAQ